jgi:hypothetical protein
MDHGEHRSSIAEQLAETDVDSLGESLDAVLIELFGHNDATLSELAQHRGHQPPEHSVRDDCVAAALEGHADTVAARL